MTSSQIIIILAVIAVIALLAVRGWGGPRVTTIETVHEKDEGEDRP
jgi:hypothetical protein